MFCGNAETVDHLFPASAVSAFLGGLSEMCCWFGYVPMSFSEISGWILLFHGKDRNLVVVGFVL